jgi:cyclic pyranopterin phosphate synthase
MEAAVKDVFGRPLRDLRISLTDRCNFRCTYCMPAEIFGERYQFLPKSQTLSFNEIDRLVRAFVELGVNKIRLTGGEPLLRSRLEDLIRRLLRIEGVEDIALTTNGYLLEQQAQALWDAGLRRVTVSIDSLDDDVFGRMNGRGFGTGRVLAGIKKAIDLGFHPIKINVVAQKGVNDQSIVDLARYFKTQGCIVRFIEYMDVGNLNHWKLDEVVSAAEIVNMITEEIPAQPETPNYLGEVAQRYRYNDGEGEFGVIASVTQPFCGDCTRARLTTDGKLVTCLFANDGLDLRGPLRTGASHREIKEIIASAWKVRKDRYSEERGIDDSPRERKVEMFQIGG